jgi:hypothetical protein
MKYPNELKHDPIEDNPEIKKIIDIAGKEAETQLKNEPRNKGYIHVYYKTKKKILLEKYHIKWKTPVEMNPDVMIN